MKKTLKQQVVLREQRLESLFKVRDENITGVDIAFHYISEASLSRLWTKARTHDFAILTAYRAGNDKQRNVALNRDLRHELNSHRLGPIPVIGHWQECQLMDRNGEPLDWKQCPKDKLVDVVERSYFTARSESITPDVFATIIFNLGTKYKQDGVVIKVDSLGLHGVYNPRNRSELVKFSKGIGMNQVAQAYSRHVKKTNVPFVFEGIEVPSSTSYGLKALREEGFYWDV